MTENKNSKNKISDVYELALKEGFSEVEYKNDSFYVKLKRRRLASGKKTAVQELLEIPRVKSYEPKVPLNPVKAPINGIFYRSPSPQHPLFVNEGDIVEQGAVLCIIEAMKVMNEIHAESKMRIEKILVENGKSVSEGQDIFLVEIKAE